MLFNELLKVKINAMMYDMLMFNSQGKTRPEVAKYHLAMYSNTTKNVYELYILESNILPPDKINVPVQNGVKMFEFTPDLYKALSQKFYFFEVVSNGVTITPNFAFPAYEECGNFIMQYTKDTRMLDVMFNRLKQEDAAKLPPQPATPVTPQQLAQMAAARAKQAAMKQQGGAQVSNAAGVPPVQPNRPPAQPNSMQTPPPAQPPSNAPEVVEVEAVKDEDDDIVEVALVDEEKKPTVIESIDDAEIVETTVNDIIDSLMEEEAEDTNASSAKATAQAAETNSAQVVQAEAARPAISLGGEQTAVEVQQVEPEEAVEAQPEEVEEVIEAQPVEVEEVVEMQPIEYEEAAEAEQEEEEAVVEAQPVEVEEVVEAQQEEEEAVVEAQPIEYEEAVEAGQEEEEAVVEAQPIEYEEAAEAEEEAAVVEAQPIEYEEAAEAEEEAAVVEAQPIEYEEAAEAEEEAAVVEAQPIEYEEAAEAEQEEEAEVVEAQPIEYEEAAEAEQEEETAVVEAQPIEYEEAVEAQANKEEEVAEADQEDEEVAKAETDEEDEEEISISEEDIRHILPVKRYVRECFDTERYSLADRVIYGLEVKSEASGQDYRINVIKSASMDYDELDTDFEISKAIYRFYTKEEFYFIQIQSDDDSEIPNVRFASTDIAKAYADTYKYNTKALDGMFGNIASAEEKKEQANKIKEGKHGSITPPFNMSIYAKFCTNLQPEEKNMKADYKCLLSPAGTFRQYMIRVLKSDSKPYQEIEIPENDGKPMFAIARDTYEEFTKTDFWYIEITHNKKTGALNKAFKAFENAKAYVEDYKEDMRELEVLFKNITPEQASKMQPLKGEDIDLHEEIAGSAPTIIADKVIINVKNASGFTGFGGSTDSIMQNTFGNNFSDYMSDLGLDTAGFDGGGIGGGMGYDDLMSDLGGGFGNDFNAMDMFDSDHFSGGSFGGSFDFMNDLMGGSGFGMEAFDGGFDDMSPGFDVFGASDDVFSDLMSFEK